MFKKAHRVSASGACDAVIFVWGAVITASVSDLILLLVDALIFQRLKNVIAEVIQIEFRTCGAGTPSAEPMVKQVLLWLMSRYAGKNYSCHGWEQETDLVIRSRSCPSPPSPALQEMPFSTHTSATSKVCVAAGGRGLCDVRLWQGPLEGSSCLLLDPPWDSPCCQKPLQVEKI